MTAIAIPLTRERRGWGARVEIDGRRAAAPRMTSRPPVVARTLALAIEMQGLLDRGEVRSASDLADMLGFTRARVSQMLDLTLLAPDIQEQILFAEETRGRDEIRERELRRVVREPDWRRQRELWSELGSRRS